MTLKLPKINIDTDNAALTKALKEEFGFDEQSLADGQLTPEELNEGSLPPEVFVGFCLYDDDDRSLAEGAPVNFSPSDLRRARGILDYNLLSYTQGGNLLKEQLKEVADVDTLPILAERFDQLAEPSFTSELSLSTRIFSDKTPIMLYKKRFFRVDQIPFEGVKQIARSVGQFYSSGSLHTGYPSLEWSASGILLDQNTIATAGHVMNVRCINENCLPTSMRFGKDQFPIEPEEILSDRKKDLAVLNLKTPVPSERFPHATIVDTSQADYFKIGDRFFVIGFPDEKSDENGMPYISVGNVINIDSNLYWDPEGMRVTLDAIAFSGNSGGAVVNEKGEIVGIVNRGSSDGATTFVPIHYLEKMSKNIGK